MPQGTKLNRTSLSQQIREALLERIVSGVLKPGDRLVELKIAEEMQTSQAPVREALRELEAIGLIESQRNRGTRVRTLDETELAEIYMVRAELEALAGDIVANGDPELSIKLEKIVERMKKAADKGDIKKFVMLNSEFHGTIIQATGNNTLVRVWEGLDVSSRTWVNMSLTAADLHDFVDSHSEIAHAIAKGDAAEARELSWRHVRESIPNRAD